MTFNCGGAATITVTSTKTISADTTIDGGSVITISGGGTVGVFTVDPCVTFTAESLTIANGNNTVTFGLRQGGGAINSNGALTVMNSTFSGNSALGASGGAISSGGPTLTVSDSTFSNNSALSTYGGAIYTTSTSVLTVLNSTFSGNSALHDHDDHHDFDDEPGLSDAGSVLRAAVQLHQLHRRQRRAVQG